jgi:hypothetical protein
MNDLTEDEVERRMNDAMRKALNTPPQPKPTGNPEKGKPSAAEATSQRPGGAGKAS